MKVVTTLAELRAARAQFSDLAFVPTMGYLHDGHLSLVREGARRCPHVAASIFVNPLQFGPSEDLATYPRDLERDLAALAKAGCDLVWTPRDQDIYPPGFATFVEVEQVTSVLEGQRRPGHFRGVTTVVTILLNAMQPTVALFGQKDAQQAVVLRKMTTDLAMPVEVVIAPIVREPDGLAMSSRNTYLDPQQRQAATVLSRALRDAQAAWGGGERDAGVLRSRMEEILAAEPLAVPDYVSVADPDTLAELDVVDPSVGALASMAVRIGRTRLIDNVLLDPR